MTKYRLSQVAKDGLKQIYAFGVFKFGEALAEKYFNSYFFDYFEIIVQRPFSFEAVGYIRSGYHRCVCGADSIYYRVREETVEIMAIIGRQELTGDALQEIEDDDHT